MSNYELNEIPIINETFSFQNDNANNRVICCSLGEIKILNCNPNILEEVLR